MSKISVKYSGDIQLKKEIILYNTLYVSTFGFYLIYVSSLLNEYRDYFANFSYDKFTIQQSRSPIIIGKRDEQSGSYILVQDQDNHTYINQTSIETQQYRLGHPATKKMSYLKGIIPSIRNNMFTCHVCPLAKQRKLPFKSNYNLSNNTIDLIYLDI